MTDNILVGVYRSFALLGMTRWWKFTSKTTERHFLRLTIKKYDIREGVKVVAF